MIKPKHPIQQISDTAETTESMQNKSLLLQILLIFGSLLFLTLVASFSFAQQEQEFVSDQQQQQGEQKGEEKPKTVPPKERIYDFFRKLAASPHQELETHVRPKLRRLPLNPRFQKEFCQTGKEPSSTKEKNKETAVDAGSEEYERVALSPLCGRFIIDDFISENEIELLKEFGTFGLSVASTYDGTPAGGVALVDYLNQIVSFGKSFANLTSLIRRHRREYFDAIRLRKAPKTDLASVFPEAGFQVWYKTVHKLKSLIQSTFAPPPPPASSSSSSGGAPVCDTFRLALPAFFSRIDSSAAHTVNDEYWHSHIDTEQYGSFDVTSLLYLSNEHETKTQDQFSEFITGKTMSEQNDIVGKRKDPPPQSRQELDERKEEELVPQGDFDDEEEAVNARAEGNFQGGAFEFLSKNSDEASEEAEIICSVHNSSKEFVVTKKSDPKYKKVYKTSIVSGDAQGGEAEKVQCDKLVIHPRKGRVMFFSSGPEHPHRIRKVENGVRWASTNAFTCDTKGKSVDIEEPSHQFPADWITDLLLAKL